MLLHSLRQDVLSANLELVSRGLVLYSFGNASGISRQEGLVVIKPSGVPYERLTPESMVVVDLDANAHRNPEYRKINPQMALPALVDELLSPPG